MQATLMLLTCLYAWRQMQVGYGQPGWQALAKLPLFVMGFALVHAAYRAAQFFAVFALS